MRKEVGIFHHFRTLAVLGRVFGAERLVSERRNPTLGISANGYAPVARCLLKAPVLPRGLLCLLPRLSPSAHFARFRGPPPPKKKNGGGGGTAAFSLPGRIPKRNTVRRVLASRKCAGLSTRRTSIWDICGRICSERTFFVESARFFHSLALLDSWRTWPRS